ncbi:MAG: hypothetical protein Q9227_004614 [Pyrenula ochraceoflavens]
MSRSLGRPKRAAEDFTRTHDLTEEGPVSKKPRFDIRNPSALAPDALEEDVTLDADIIGHRGQQVRRGAVNIDGYDSDSENENFDARAEAKAKQKADTEKSKDEEQEDMFADLAEDFEDGDDEEGDATRRQEGKGKKAVRFLDADEIEGQVDYSKSGGHVSADFRLSTGAKGKEKDRGQDREVESSSESEVDEDTRADAGDVDEEVGAGGKKAHAPKLDAFNMRNEQQEGRFDDQGNFVRKAADPDAAYDTWLEGVSKKDMRRAKEAAEKRDEERRQKDKADDETLTEDLFATLISHLENDETALEALARLGKGVKQKPKWQTKAKNRRKQQTNGHADEEDVSMSNSHNEDPTETSRKATIETITTAADLLLGRSHPEIYDMEREMLIRLWKRETGEEWVDPSAASTENTNSIAQEDKELWEYRWSDARDGEEHHGPYDAVTMRAWRDAGYFGEGVEFRRVGVGGKGWDGVGGFG